MGELKGEGKQCRKTHRTKIKTERDKQIYCSRNKERKKEREKERKKQTSQGVTRETE